MKKHKVCFKCNIEKPVEQFYSHPEMADGRLNKCKDCTKKDVKSHYSKNRKKIAVYMKKRQSKPERKAAMSVYSKRRRERNPQVYAARYKLNNAVRDGRVVRLPCIHCGNPKSEGHHHDYSKPLDVVWLCFKCHREKEHGQITN